MRPPARLLVLPLVSLALGGCVVVAAAAAAAATYGVIKYTDNEARQDFKSDLDTTFKAAVAALRQMKYPVGDDVKPSATEGVIEVADIEVHVEKHPDFTRVRVRVGTFETEDHRRRARLILEEIDSQLGAKG